MNQKPETPHSGGPPETPRSGGPHDDERLLLEAIAVGLAILILFFLIMRAYWTAQSS